MTKEKAKPRTSANYDLELATMANCKKLIQRLPTADARWRVISYLQSATTEQPLNAPPAHVNQTTLFEAE